MGGNGIELVQAGLLSIREACAFARLSRSGLYQLMETGQLSYVKLGRRRLIPVLALQELLSRHVVGGWKNEAGGDQA